MTWTLVIVFTVGAEWYQTKGPLPPDQCLAIVREARVGNLPVIEDVSGEAVIVTVACVSPAGEEARVVVGEAAL